MYRKINDLQNLSMTKNTDDQYTNVPSPSEVTTSIERGARFQQFQPRQQPYGSQQFQQSLPSPPTKTPPCPSCGNESRKWTSPDGRTVMHDGGRRRLCTSCGMDFTVN